jgi:hypothetical protein
MPGRGRPCRRTGTMATLDRLARDVLLRYLLVVHF